MRGSRKFYQRGSTQTTLFCFSFFLNDGNDGNFIYYLIYTLFLEGCVELHQKMSCDKTRTNIDNGPPLNAGLVAL